MHRAKAVRLGKLSCVFDEHVRIYSSPYMLQRERALRRPNPADAFSVAVPQDCLLRLIWKELNRPSSASLLQDPEAT